MPGEDYFFSDLVSVVLVSVFFSVVLVSVFFSAFFSSLAGAATGAAETQNPKTPYSCIII